MFKNDQEYVTKVVITSTICSLIEDGWKCHTGEYVDDGKIFAKPNDPLAFVQ